MELPYIFISLLISDGHVSLTWIKAIAGDSSSLTLVPMTLFVTTISDQPHKKAPTTTKDNKDLGTIYDLEWPNIVPPGHW